MRMIVAAKIINFSKRLKGPGLESKSFGIPQKNMHFVVCPP
jgi:hypothetical protein